MKNSHKGVETPKKLCLLVVACFEFQPSHQQNRYSSDITSKFRIVMKKIIGGYILRRKILEKNEKFETVS